MNGRHDPLVETIARVTDIPRLIHNHEPFTTPVEKKHALIVGSTHLAALSTLFPGYALEATVVVPSTLGPIDLEFEMERAVQFESGNPKVCRGVGFARDLSGLDSDSVDYLFICTPYSQIRDQMLREAWRVVKEYGKVIVFSSVEIPPEYLSQFGIALPTYFAVEGFYVGTLRKSLAIYTKN